MPRTINPIRKALLKKALLRNDQSIEKCMIEAGYSPNTAVKSGANKVVKVSQAEILAEIDKPGLRKKAYATLERNLIQKKNKAVEVQAATSLLKFTEGEIIRNQDFDNPDEQSEYQRLRNLTASTN